MNPHNLDNSRDTTASEDSAPSHRRNQYPASLSYGVAQDAYRYRFWYSIGGLILGGLSMILGSVLFLFGATGETTWVANILGAHSEITDAAPGAILFIVGLFVVFVTRFRTAVRTSSGSYFK